MSTLKFMASLGLGLSSVLATTAALAAPAPVFEPILDEIPTDHPTLPAFRIPATVPTDVELYPSILPDMGVVFLNTEPDCEAIECTVLAVIAKSDPPPLWPFIGAKPMKSITLIDGVRAHFWQRGGMASLQWIQEGSFYVLSYRQAAFPEKVAIAMAKSMATESPYLP